MSTRTKIIIGVVIALVIGGGVVAKVKMSKDKATVVKAAAAKKQKLVEKVTAPARIQPVTIVNISADVMGQIVDLAVEEGDWVEKGQFLLQIDPSIYQSVVDRTEALVQSASANQQLAEANLRQAELDMNRKSDLFKQNLVSQQEVDITKTQVEVNQAQVRSAKEQVTQAKASLDEARSNLRKTRIIAPMAGTVSQLNVEEGEVAVTGTMNNPGTILLAVADLTRMEAEAEVDETDVIHLVTGQLVEIEVDALPDTVLTGTVREIANTARIQAQGTDQEVTNFLVKVDVSDNHGKLRPGMSATISIIANTKENVLSIPIQAVVMRRPSELKEKADDDDGKAEADEPKEIDKTEEAMTGTFLLDKMADPSGKELAKARFVQIKTGISSETDIEIVSGLNEGQEVITGPYKTLLDLRQDEKVKLDDGKGPKDNED